MANRKYTESYRQAACRLVREEKYTPQDAAKSLGMPKETLVYWLRSRGPAD
jgi:transposase-like protein